MLLLTICNVKIIAIFKTDQLILIIFYFSEIDYSACFNVKTFFFRKALGQNKGYLSVEIFLKPLLLLTTVAGILQSSSFKVMIT